MIIQLPEVEHFWNYISHFSATVPQGQAKNKGKKNLRTFRGDYPFNSTYELP